MPGYITEEAPTPASIGVQGTDIDIYLNNRVLIWEIQDEAKRLERCTFADFEVTSFVMVMQAV